MNNMNHQGIQQPFASHYPDNYGLPPQGWSGYMPPPNDPYAQDWQTNLPLVPKVPSSNANMMDNQDFYSGSAPLYHMYESYGNGPGLYCSPATLQQTSSGLSSSSGGVNAHPRNNSPMSEPYYPQNYDNVQGSYQGGMMVPYSGMQNHIQGDCNGIKMEGGTQKSHYNSNYLNENQYIMQGGNGELE